MDQHHSDHTWGFHVNSSLSARSGRVPYPSWANPAQREKWKEHGVIVWDEQSQTVTRLWAQQALYVLEYLLENQEWENKGITFGEPVTRLSIDHPEQPPQKVLVNQITLDAAQTRELLSQLRQHESILRQMAEADEQDRRRRLAAIYDLLLRDHQQGEAEKK